jgi:hypothetical protein
MRRSAVEAYLNPGPGVPMATFQQTYPTGTSAWQEDLRKRAETNQKVEKALADAYSLRIESSAPTPFRRTAAAISQEAGNPVGVYSGGPGEVTDVQEGLPGGMDRSAQEYGGPGNYTSVDAAAQTAPARAIAGVPQEQEVQSGAFQNTDEYTRDIPGVSAAMQFPSEYAPQTVSEGLPAPFDSPESILATFGENPNKGQLTRMVALKFHPDVGGDTQLYQNVSNAINNAYGKVIIGSGRRKYRY